MGGSLDFLQIAPNRWINHTGKYAVGASQMYGEKSVVLQHHSKLLSACRDALRHFSLRNGGLDQLTNC